MSSSEVDLAMVRVRELRALLLRSDTGHPAGPHTHAELPLVLTPGVRVAAGSAGEAQLGGQALVPDRAVLLGSHAPPHQTSHQPPPAAAHSSCLASNEAVKLERNEGEKKK